jgi:uncharacterized membrane-anchored protein YitT (DUF2179 family)
MTQETAPYPHTPLEDAQALLGGTLLVALGVVLFRQAGLATGGTAGISFLLHYATGWPFGAIFFAINLPFYVFAQRTMGWAFTIKSFISVGLLSLYAELLPQLIHIDSLQPSFAAVMGGMLFGIGLLMLIRHRSSLGGLGVLAIYLQQKRGWSAGKTQMAADCVVVAAAFTIMDPLRVAFSIVGAIVLNLVLTFNHRPGRYMGF